MADDPRLPSKTTSPARIQAALAALAEFHEAVAASPEHALGHASAPGILKRLDRIESLQIGGLDRLASEIEKNRNLWPELADRSPPLLAMFSQMAPNITGELRRRSGCSVSIRPCIRDIHRQHVLFEGDQVKGIIDFGSMQPDNVSADIARLLGSMALDDGELWQTGLAAYQAVQPLTQIELQLVPAYDRSAVLLSGINWLQWVFIENRQFDDRAEVLSRFDSVISRLAKLANPPTASLV